MLVGSGKPTRCQNPDKLFCRAFRHHDFDVAELLGGSIDLQSIDPGKAPNKMLVDGELAAVFSANARRN